MTPPSSEWEHFLALQANVQATLDEEVAKMRRVARSWPSFVFVAQWTARVLIIMVAFRTYLVPTRNWGAVWWQSLNVSDYLRPYLILIEALFPAFLLIICVCLTFFPIILVVRRLSRPQLRLMALVQSFLFNPLWYLAPVVISQTLREGMVPIVDIWVTLVFVICVLLLFSASLFSYVLMASHVFPSIFFFLLPTTPLTALTDALPTHESTIEQAHQRAQSLLSTWPRPRLAWVREVANQRTSSLDAQIQAATSLLGVLGVLGLLTLLIPEGQVQERVATLDRGFESFFILSGPLGAQWLLPLLLIALAAAILISLSYLAHQYRQLRVLELIALLCLMAEAERPADPPPAPPTPRTWRDRVRAFLAD